MRGAHQKKEGNKGKERRIMHSGGEKKSKSNKSNIVPCVGPIKRRKEIKEKKEESCIRGGGGGGGVVA
jgi:hypothetical protein